MSDSVYNGETFELPRPNFNTNSHIRVQVLSGLRLRGRGVRAKFRLQCDQSEIREDRGSYSGIFDTSMTLEDVDNLITVLQYARQRAIENGATYETPPE